MSEKGFEKATVPNEEDSGEQTRQGKFEENRNCDCDIISASFWKVIKQSSLATECKEAGEEDECEPKEAAAKYSFFCDHLADSHLSYYLNVS